MSRDAETVRNCSRIEVGVGFFVVPRYNWPRLQPIDKHVLVTSYAYLCLTNAVRLCDPAANSGATFTQCNCSTHHQTHFLHQPTKDKVCSAVGCT